MILVVGATGAVGGRIARTLRERGEDTRVLVRSGSDYQSLVDAGMQPVVGDLNDRASLDAACAGVETVVTTATAFARGGADNFQTVELEGNQRLIAAAAAAGVRHFVFISSVLADPDSPVPYVSGKGHAEGSLRASGMDYTILAPNGYFEYFVQPVVGVPAQAGREVVLVGEGRRRHTFVAADDVAAFAVAAVDNPRAVNQRLPIGGPAAISYRDVIGLYKSALGRPIAWRGGAPAEVDAGVSPAARAFLPFLDTVDSTFDSNELARSYGVELTPAADWIARQLARA